MEIEKPLQKTTHQDPVLSAIFYLGEQPVYLHIYSDSFNYYNAQINISSLYTHETKFDIILNENSWTLILYYPNKVEFRANSNPFSRQWEIWEETLIKFIRRVGFHDFFKGIKRIGKGSFASVYLSEKNSNGKLYAVKAFQKQSTYKAHKGKEGLDNQITVLRSLDQINIPKLHGVYETQNSIYMVQEYIHGKNLGELLDEKKTLPVPTRKKIIKEILSALAQMESKYIVHRDIKPDNIMIQNGGVAKVVDYGLATDVRLQQYLFVRCGTPGHVAPEILSIRDTGNAKLRTVSDVFSAGAVFYQMIFGTALFEGDTNSQILDNNRKGLIDIPFSSNFENDFELLLLRRMLDHCPDSRIKASEALKLPYFAKNQTLQGKRPHSEVQILNPKKKQKLIFNDIKNVAKYQSLFGKPEKRYRN